MIWKLFTSFFRSQNHAIDKSWAVIDGPKNLGIWWNKLGRLDRNRVKANFIRNFLKFTKYPSDIMFYNVMSNSGRVCSEIENERNSYHNRWTCLCIYIYKRMLRNIGNYINHELRINYYEKHK